MPGGFTDVSKGLMMERSDQRLSQQPGETVKEYRSRLEKLLSMFKSKMPLTEHSKTLLDIGRDQVTSSTPQLEKHVRDEFFGQNQGAAFFPNVPPRDVEEIVRGGFIRAIEISLATKAPKSPKPIVGYWVIANRQDSEGDVFEVFVAETPREVHVLMLTPKPAPALKPPGANKSRAELMWVVSTKKRVNAIANSYPGDYKKTFVDVDAEGVACVQVMGY
jgi:hypothetical protein